MRSLAVCCTILVAFQGCAVYQGVAAPTPTSATLPTTQKVGADPYVEAERLAAVFDRDLKKRG